MRRGPDRRDASGVPLREAFDALSGCLKGDDDEAPVSAADVQRRLRNCAFIAWRLGLTRERFVVVLHEILDQRPALAEQLEERVDPAPCASRRDTLFAWAISEFGAAGSD